MVRMNIKAAKDVIENESHLIPKIVHNNLGGVENKTLIGSMLMANGEECLVGWVGADGGEAMGGGVDFRVIVEVMHGEIPGRDYG
ncbi:hypothetical protein Tco_1482027 [Tanacetum coccineum]